MVKVKGIYVLLHSITLRTISLLSLKLH